VAEVNEAPGRATVSSRRPALHCAAARRLL